LGSVEMATKKNEDNQLRLIDETEWVLDDHTREIGRQGVAAARRLLSNASASSAPQSTRRPHAA
jgi:hypothetical protein